MYNFPIIYNPDGSELIAAWKDGKQVLIPFYTLQSLSAPVLAAVPSTFVATVYDSYQIDLSWTGTGTNYIIERCRDNDGLWLEIYNGSGTSFSDNGLSPECDYYYRIRAQEAGKFDSDFLYDNDTTPALP